MYGKLELYDSKLPMFGYSKKFAYNGQNKQCLAIYMKYEYAFH